MILRTDIINYLVEKHNYQRYLEIGLDSGKNFKRIKVTHKESVDPAQGQYSNARPTHKMTSDNFFAQVNTSTKWDIIFIDGLHHADQVYRDIDNSLKHLNDGGSIVCHDMNPTKEVWQIVPRQSTCWTGDCWKAWVRFRAENGDLRMKVYNTDLGVGVIQRGVGEKLDLNGLDLEYSNLEANRKEWLNLVEVNSINDL